MKAFKGYEESRERAKFTATSKLPVGAYIVKILDVDYQEGQGDYSDRINLEFDISEGDYAGFFAKQYDENTNEDKKWKGKTSIYVPKDDGSEKDGWTKNTFAKWTAALEESNPKYIWDWDEKKWIDKKLGIVFGETGTVINGREITYTEARFPVSVEVVKSGKAPL